MKKVFISVSGNSVKRLFIILVCFLQINHSYGQSPNDLTRQINRKLKVLSSPSPDVPGGYIFDNSYEGMKGSPLLFSKFDTLKIMVKEVDYYIPVEANIDLRNNTLLYKDPETRQLYSIPSERIAELIAGNGNDTMLWKTTENKIFDTEIKEIRFIQVMKQAPNSFIKIPYKIFIPADYSGAYTAKRRYDEYKTEYRYFVMNHENIYKEIKLSESSLIKVFPEKREIIKKSFRMSKASDKEKIVLSVLGNL
ncbi:MAG TPA: hypothetical protein VK207_03375 [Bacteroidales bacterium]|nr:hypothetical protein [Bacteroidales bacterium]